MAIENGSMSWLRMTIAKGLRGLFSGSLLGQKDVGTSDAPDELPRPGRLRGGDHAFASGGVFRRPRDLEEAVKLTGSVEEGELLFDVWRQFLTNGVVGDNVLLGLNSRMLNDLPDRNHIRVGDQCVLRGLVRQEAQGRIEIGRLVYFGDNSIISSMAEVVIGDETLIAHNVNIFDNDSHPIGAEQRAAHFKRLLGIKTGVPFHIERAPVRIGRRCWLGLNSVITKGVEIGDDTIVSAGSVVTKSLPAGVLAAGIPAKPIKDL